MAKTALQSTLKNLRLDNDVTVIVYPNDHKQGVVIWQGREHIFSMGDLKDLIAQLEWLRRQMEAYKPSKLEGEHNIPFPRHLPKNDFP